MIPAMSESTYRPKQVADQLGISPATLRLWSNKFESLLAPAAQRATTETGTSAQRRYSDHDVRFFTRAKQLLGEGKTYEETLAILTDEGVPDPEILAGTPDDEIKSDSDNGDLSNALALQSQAHMAVLAMREALSAKDETIEALRTTISANERHVDDLRAENDRLREQLKEQEKSTTQPPAAAEQQPWWKRLIGGS